LLASCEANNVKFLVSEIVPNLTLPVARPDWSVEAIELYLSTCYWERFVLHKSCVVKYTRNNVVGVLNKAGFAHAADEAAMELPDPIDFERFEEWAMRRGITRDALMSAMGGSP
jgi:hypothetical protein